MAGALALWQPRMRPAPGYPGYLSSGACPEDGAREDSPERGMLKRTTNDNNTSIPDDHGHFRIRQIPINERSTMSLIVARRFNDSITIVSDTRITYESKHKVDPDQIRGAVIKTVVLSPTFSLSFAGDENFAGNTIVAAFHWQQLDRNEIVNKLLAEHLRSIDSTPTDFIVAFHKPTRLVVIKDGGATDTDSGWIGMGFERFQYAMLKDKDGAQAKPSKDTLSMWHVMAIDPSSEGSPEGLPGKMLRAMQEVIDDPDQSTVGGIPIILVTQKNSFCYGEHLMFTGGVRSYDEYLLDGKVALQEASTGSCTVYSTSSQIGYVVSPVIYFLEPQLGLIFGPSKKGTLHSNGIKSSSFDLLLWTLRDELNCRVASHLPSSEELRRLSEMMLPKKRHERNRWKWHRQRWRCRG